MLIYSIIKINKFHCRQKQIQLDTNNSINTDSNHEQKSAYKIPSPTILLRNELSPSSVNKISRSTSSVFNQPNSFYLKYPEEFLPMTSEILNSAVQPLSLDLKLLRDNETIPHISSQIKTRPEIKHVFMS